MELLQYPNKQYGMESRKGKSKQLNTQPLKLKQGLSKHRSTIEDRSSFHNENSNQIPNVHILLNF